jgi:hypothetical protein
MKTKQKQIKLSKIIPRFDEEELNFKVKKFPKNGITLKESKTQLKFQAVCLVNDYSILFELDFLFDSGQIVTLTFTKDCSNYVETEKMTPPIKKKILKKKKPIKKKISLKTEDHSIQLKATNAIITKRTSVFGLIGG